MLSGSLIKTNIFEVRLDDVKMLKSICASLSCRDKLCISSTVTLLERRDEHLRAAWKLLSLLISFQASAADLQQLYSTEESAMSVIYDSDRQ